MTTEEASAESKGTAAKKASEKSATDKGAAKKKAKVPAGAAAVGTAVEASVDTSVDTASLILEKSLVSETAEVVERRNRVEQLLESAEQGKDKVKPDIYKRVTSDYRGQLSEIAAEYSPLRARVIAELERIREEELGLRKGQGKLNEYLDEIRFRCQVGEFAEDELLRLEKEKESTGYELETKLVAIEKTFKTSEDLLGEDVESAMKGSPEPEPEPEPMADSPVPDGTVMMSTNAVPSIPDGPVPDGTVMMTDADVARIPDGPVPDGTVMMGDSLPKIPDGPVPDGTVMMTDDDVANIPDGPVPDGTVMMTDADVARIPDGPVPDGTVLLDPDGEAESTDDMPRALLTRTKPEDGKVFVINLDELSIGRSTTNDVIIEGASVSRRHATICYEDGAYVIQDHSSGGGILVNGQRQEKAQLATGDEIAIGSSVFDFEGPA